jgi:hypothetical protein
MCGVPLAGCELFHRSSEPNNVSEGGAPSSGCRSKLEYIGVMSTERKLSPLQKQAADALRRARRLPVGPHRNDLRKLAAGLLRLHRDGMEAFAQGRSNAVVAELGEQNRET